MSYSISGYNINIVGDDIDLSFLGTDNFSEDSLNYSDQTSDIGAVSDQSLQIGAVSDQSSQIQGYVSPQTGARNKSFGQVVCQTPSEVGRRRMSEP